MPKPANYVLLDFDQLNEKGLQPLVKAIKAGGFEVAKVIPAGTSRKKDGVATKTFSLVAIDEQVMQIQVNDTGDISGVRVNGKNAPFTHSTNLNQVGQQLAKLFSTGATAFEKAMAKKIARQATKDDGSSPKKPGIKSNAQLLSDAKARRDAVKDDIDKTQSRLTTTQQKVNDNASQVSKLTQDLTSEKSLTKQLKEQIADLEGKNNG
ncbi:hypothetical protein [Rosenbergiella epipactidis]|uniref:defense against restriction DarA-related protein n=1 Tax=Rosenbergiella epipactidis TaxID=1544694 RepID=UPI001F4D7CF5|nr:hypothetical protein [Rosenbergiella epipactidis]